MPSVASSVTDSKCMISIRPSSSTSVTYGVFFGTNVTHPGSEISSLPPSEMRILPDRR